MSQPDRRRIEGRSQPVQQVDPEEHLVHAAADQKVEARQQVRQVHVQPGSPRHFAMRGENADRDDD